MDNDRRPLSRLSRLSHGTTAVGDEDRLAELGYKQELKRNWSLLHNFGVSFSIIVSNSGKYSGGALTWVRVFPKKDKTFKPLFEPHSMPEIY